MSFWNQLHLFLHSLLYMHFFSGETYEAQSEAQSDEEEELCAQDLINFAPVYRCLHIYTVLGAREQFETYYRQQRREQARLALQPPTNMVGYKNSEIIPSVTKSNCVIHYFAA